MPVSHVKRVTEELKKAGISPLALYRLTSAHVPRIVHEDERIEAAVYGRKKESEGIFGIIEGMLIATDRRIIFIDYRPGFTTMDDISYDVVAGVNLSTALFTASVTLYTRIANYHLSHVSLKSAQRFTDFIENRIEVFEEQKVKSKGEQLDMTHETKLDEKALTFLREHEIGVLSTIDRTGTLRGTVVYYVMRNGYPHFVTKEGTQKVGNIVGNQRAAFTVFDENRLETVQLAGMVESVNNNETRIEIITSVLRPRTYEDNSHLAPVIRMGPETATLVFRIMPTDYSFIDFKNPK